MRECVCRLQLLLVLASAAILGPKSSGTHDHILMSQIRDFPHLDGQVPVFLFPRKRVAQLYPQALGFLFVASYYSQDYGGGIRTSLHTGTDSIALVVLPITSRHRLHREHRSLSYSIVHAETRLRHSVTAG
jgi:hypothetical protein